MYKLIALDLDETLLGPDLTIGEPEKAALAVARARGIDVTFVTARAWRSTKLFAAELGLTAPVICMMGAVVYDPDGRPGRCVPVPREEARRIVSWAAAEDWCLRLYFVDGRVYQSRAPGDDYQPSQPVHAYGIEQYTPNLLPLLDDEDEPIQVVALGHRGVESLLARLIESPRLMATTFERHSTVSRTHVTHRDVTKGGALERYCRERGIEREAVIAMGDSETDRSMIEWAGTGVAMGWAPEHVRRVADVVAAPDDRHPVATVLNQLLGL